VFYGITCENYRRELFKIFDLGSSKKSNLCQTSTIHLNYIPNRTKKEARAGVNSYYTFVTSVDKKKKEQKV